jgi:hypothetical protein
MKTIRQIANECGLLYDVVYHTVKHEGLVTEHGHSKIRLTKYQEDYIHDVLYHSGYFNTLTFESKMNNLDSKELYSRKKFIEKGLIIENNL